MSRSRAIARKAHGTKSHADTDMRARRPGETIQMRVTDGTMVVDYVEGDS